MGNQDIEAKVPNKSADEQNPDERLVAEDSAREDTEIKKLSAELEDLRQTLVRHQADFANYRKRAERENKEAFERAVARLIEGLIPVIDGFEHALAAHREPEYEGHRKGFEIIYKQLLDHVKRLGAERIDPTGKPFDPNLHQAMDREVTQEHADGTVLEMFQPGYVYHGRVLRPAMVRVAVHPNPASNRAVN